MDLRSFCRIFSKDLDLGKTAVIVCDCEIDYDGRSRSNIGSGERILLFKPDSTIIIHSPRGFKPVNWMSSPTDTAVSWESERPLIFSQRTAKPHEKIKIYVNRVISHSSFDSLMDAKRLSVTHTEHDMRDYLAKNPCEVDPRFRLKSKEYKTKVGLIDLWGKIGDSYCIVELKSVRAGLPAVLQLKRYRDHMKQKLNQEIGAILMAPSCAKNPLDILKSEAMNFKKFDLKSIRHCEAEKTLDKWM